MSSHVRPRRLLKRFEAFYWGHGIADDAPALTYYLMLSLAPFALGLAAITAIVFGGGLSPLEVTDSVSRLLPIALREDVADMVISTRRDSVQLLALAIFAMLWTSAGAIGVVERCLSRILQRERYPMVRGKLRNVAFGAALAATMISAAAAGSVISGLAGTLGADVGLPALTAVSHGASVVVVCAVVYRLLPKGGMCWRAALEGAIPAALMLQAAPLLVGVYFNHAATLSVGKIFFSLALVLAGCHVMAQGLLLGAGLAARRQCRLERRANAYVQP